MTQQKGFKSKRTQRLEAEQRRAGINVYLAFAIMIFAGPRLYLLSSVLQAEALVLVGVFCTMICYFVVNGYYDAIKTLVACSIWTIAGILLLPLIGGVHGDESNNFTRFEAGVLLVAVLPWLWLFIFGPVYEKIKGVQQNPYGVDNDMDDAGE